MPVTRITGKLIQDATLTDADVAAANKDGLPATPSMRTLGIGSQQAAAGDDARLSDDRTADGIRTATTVVSVDGSAAPTAGQVLTAVNGTSATWQDNVGGISPADYVVEEIPTGAIDGVNDTFTLANTPIVGSQQVYLNGTRMREGAGEDYQISGGTITFEAGQLPETGDSLVVDYLK